jgi:glycosyltransferase involved in cell wall biosynthesis
MDGLEWKRTKYSKRIQKFLLWAEKLGVKYSDHLISDSKGIQDYLLEKYNKVSEYIPYGADVISEPTVTALREYGLTTYNYNLLIARLEPENSIEIILDGIVKSNLKTPFLIVGNHATKYGEYLKNKYKAFPHLKFLGGIYDMAKLDSIRYFSNVYFHGHTVGGTNPSLLEAMASNSLVCANDNSFNRYILEDDGLYFGTADDVANVLKQTRKLDSKNQAKLVNNRQKLKAIYRWETIVEQYILHFEAIQGRITRSKKKIYPNYCRT